MLSNIIKAATAPLHSRLEQLLFSAAIMNGSFGIADYKKVLRVNYFMHRLLEPLLFDAIGKKTSGEIELGKRQKLAALEADMQASGMDCSDNGNIPVEYPALDSEAEALGVLYVLEGATLGGQLIIRQLKKNDSFSQLPLAYYNVYAEHTGIMWKQFLGVMNRCKDHDLALQGARKVYQLYIEAAEAIKRS